MSPKMPHKMPRIVPVILACLAAGTLTYAQETKKKAPASPPAETSITLDGKKISVEYSAPSVRGRKIVGGLVPNGQVWRTGANAATTLKTEADLDLGGLLVPKGEYTLYSLPEQNQWTLIVNKQTGQWGTEYSQSQDLGRVKMKVAATQAPVETFKISLAGTGAKTGTLSMTWENFVASVPIAVK